MAEEILDKIRDGVEAPIDFEGQRFAEQLTTNGLAIIGCIALIVGYFTQNISYTLYTGLAGTALAFIGIVPPWPFFNQHTPKWLPPRIATASGISVNMDNKKAS